MTTTIPTPKKPREVWLDWLRFLALFTVVVCHSCDPFTSNPDPVVSGNPLASFWGAIAQSSIRCCVPLFVIMTGYLLLPIKEQMGAFYKKRILRVLWPFLIWSVIYNLFPFFTMHLGGTADTVTTAFVLASGNNAPTGLITDSLALIARVPFDFSVYGVHMWYVYLVIGLYLYLPIFSAWVEKATDRQKVLFLIIWGVTLFIPYATPFTEQLWGTCSWNSFGMLYYFAGFSGYLLLGHMLGKAKIASWGKTLALAIPLFVVGYIITFIGFRITQAELYTGSFNDIISAACSPATVAKPYVPIQELFLLYCSPNVVMMTIAVVLVFKHFTTAPPVIGKMLANLTACGFGLYLIHYLFIGLSYFIVSSLGAPEWLIIPAGAVLTFAIAWPVTALLRKLVPGKWFLG